MDWELIFWCALGVPCALFMLLAFLTADKPKSDKIDIEYITKNHR